MLERGLNNIFILLFKMQLHPRRFLSLNIDFQTLLNLNFGFGNIFSKQYSMFSFKVINIRSIYPAIGFWLQIVFHASHCLKAIRKYEM
jgi:hypothetical protein